MNRKFAMLATAATLTLAGCGAGEDFNDADVAFATDMIPHHAQALEMVELTEGRTLDPEVQALADDIRGAQDPEIETMTGWLTEWDEPVPDATGMEMDSEMSGMSGMMSGQEMTDLESASDADFQDLWLEMMVEHHTGAVEMAEAQQEDGEYDPAIDLAGDIEASQTKEIEVMEGLLAS